MTSIAYVALWLFIFTIPWTNSVVVPGLGTISRLMGIMALMFALLAVMASGRFRRWHLFHLMAVLFIIWGGCSVLLFQARGTIPMKYKTYVQLVAVAWIVWEVARSRRATGGLLAAYVAGGYVAALNTILVFRSEAAIMRRFAAAGFDANDLAMTLALALPMAWYLGMHSRRPLMRWLARGYLPLGFLAIALTGSRGGMLASVVGLLIVPLTMRNLSPGRLAAAIALLSMSGGVAIAYTPQRVLERLATTKSEVEVGTLNGRLGIWKAGGKALLARPVTGVGSGGFPKAVAPYLGEARVAHNAFISVLVEEGFVGFLLYVGMLGAVFSAVLRLSGVQRRFGMILLATVGVAMLPLGWEDAKPAWFVFAALVALSQARVAGVCAVVEAPPLFRPLPGRPRQPLAVRVRNDEGDAIA